MSRIGRLPIPIPDGVEVDIKGSTVSVKGPKGELTRTFNDAVDFAIEDGELKVTRKTDEKFHRSMHGTARAIVDNMVTGVKDGFDKYLEIHGVGYRAEMKGKTLVLQMGYSHLVEMEPPAGIEFALIERQDMVNVPGFMQGATGMIKVSGYDKEVVGETAALIRKVRKVEPYKGKGIRYAGEYVRRKAGKAGKAAG
jgi:large subunit ribosomal protein L6